MWPWRALWGDDRVAVGAVGVPLLPVLVAFEEGERFGGSRAGQLLPLRVALLAEVEDLRPVFRDGVVGHLDHHREPVLERRPTLVMVAEAIGAFAGRDAPHGGALVRIPLRTSRLAGLRGADREGVVCWRSLGVPG